MSARQEQPRKRDQSSRGRQVIGRRAGRGTVEAVSGAVRFVRIDVGAELLLWDPGLALDEQDVFRRQWLFLFQPLADGGLTPVDQAPKGALRARYADRFRQSRI